MTQGRFEALYTRADGFDERQFWAEGREDGHRYNCATDHKQRESCPFHDLRADGCFQPERWGAGVGSTANIAPAELFARKRGGKPFATSVGKLHSMVGCGGTSVPVDTAPAQDAQKRPKTDARPWTSTKKATNLFSSAPYMTVPPSTKIVPPVEPPFRTSRASLGTHFAHIPDTYGKRVTCERPAFRLKAGKAPFRLDPRLKFAPEREQDAVSKKPRRAIPRSTYADREGFQGTFGRYPNYVPTPYDEPKLKSQSRPIFTYHTHSKRSMPIACTWQEAGLTTAEPKRPRSAIAEPKRELKQRPRSAI